MQATEATGGLGHNGHHDTLDLNSSLINVKIRSTVMHKDFICRPDAKTKIKKLLSPKVLKGGTSKFPTFDYRFNTTTKTYGLALTCILVKFRYSKPKIVNHDTA